MKKEIYTCDKCGADITLGIQLWRRPYHTQLDLFYWHGGSMGGEEDIDHFDFYLCDDCARKLSNYLQNWLKNKNE